MIPPKPYSEACDQNKHPILNVITEEFRNAKTILEVGSGTGQHAVFFAERLPHLHWQTSDVQEHHPGINAWLSDANLSNLLQPLELDVTQSAWPATRFDGVFSANTTHIMSWVAVESFFKGVGQVLATQGRFCLYGPFNVDGQYTSESNARFDNWLKSRDPLSGIRDQGVLKELATSNGLQFVKEIAMPANNKMLIWQKT